MREQGERGDVEDDGDSMRGEKEEREEDATVCERESSVERSRLVDASGLGEIDDMERLELGERRGSSLSFAFCFLDFFVDFGFKDNEEFEKEG